MPHRKARGLIGKIQPAKLLIDKIPSSVTKQIQDIVNLLTIPDGLSQRIGSSTFKVQKYFSDLDINQFFSMDAPPEVVVDHVAEAISNLVSRLEGSSTRSKMIFFSDFKAGVDANGESLHWSSREILKGKKGKLLLSDAFLQHSVIKLDIIAPLGDRFIEASTFFILSSGTNFINLPQDFNEQFESALKQEITKYLKIKPFKAVKRLWSLGRLHKDTKLLAKLEPMINSNLSLLSQINADLETLVLMLEKVDQLPVQTMIKMIDNIRDKLATILDIDFPEAEYDQMILQIEAILSARQVDRPQAIALMEALHDSILSVLNKETLDYLKHIKLKIASYGA